MTAGGHMQRELNPALFGQMQNDAGTDLSAQTQMKNRVLEPSRAQHLGSLIQIEHQIAEMKNQMRAMQENMNKMVQYMNENLKTLNTKSDLLNKNVSKLEQQDQMIVQEASQKILQMHSRLAERKSLDVKIQEMVDRQNTILRSYEARMNQMQKILSDKDAQLIQMQAALQETKVEIARLKRL